MARISSAGFATDRDGDNNCGSFSGRKLGLYRGAPDAGFATTALSGAVVSQFEL